RPSSWSPSLPRRSALASSSEPSLGHALVRANPPNGRFAYEACPGHHAGADSCWGRNWGGRDMTAQSVQTDVAWRARPLLSAGVRLLAYGTPIVAATLFVRTFAPTLTHGLARVPAVLVAMFLAIAVSLLVSRLSMRLLPLVVLLRLEMLFHDKAPSRLKVARRATSMREITRLLGSKDLTEHEAAETMLA